MNWSPIYHSTFNLEECLVIGWDYLTYVVQRSDGNGILLSRLVSSAAAVAICISLQHESLLNLSYCLYILRS